MKSTSYRLPAKTYTIKRGGKTITLHRKAQVVHRESYTYRKPDLGKPGKGPRLIKIRRPGALRKVGYSTSKPAKTRHRALDKAVQRYGALGTWRMLNAQVVFRKRTQPRQAKIFKADRDYIRRKYRPDVARHARRKWMSMSPQARAKAMPGGKT